jgi:TPR repeat protein
MSTFTSRGVAFAQNQLGNMYATGYVVEFDHAESFLWYKKAADAGDSEAEFRVGHAFILGNGVPMSYYDAFKWLKKSIDSGNEQALKPMVVDIGLSVKIKCVLIGFAAQFCGSESANAELVLGLMHYNGNGNVVPIDMTEAFFWFDLAVKSDDKHFEAQFYLGRAYYLGEGTPINKEVGLKKINIAAKEGIPQAVSFLESLE